MYCNEVRNVSSLFWARSPLLSDRIHLCEKIENIEKIELRSFLEGPTTATASEARNSVLDKTVR